MDVNAACTYRTTIKRFMNYIDRCTENGFMKVEWEQGRCATIFYTGGGQRIFIMTALVNRDLDRVQGWFDPMYVNRSELED